MTRPKRLWVVVLVNAAVGILTLAALGYLFAKMLPVAGTVILTLVPTVLICGARRGHSARTARDLVRRPAPQLHR